MGRGRPLSGRLRSFTGAGAALQGYPTVKVHRCSAIDLDRTQILTLLKTLHDYLGSARRW
jgi:hypothetical protein